MSRADRRKEAAESRKEMKLRWLDLALQAAREGKSTRDALDVAAKEAAADIKKQPYLASQIVQAWTEFCATIRETAKSLVIDEQNARESANLGKDPQATAG